MLQVCLEEATEEPDEGGGDEHLPVLREDATQDQEKNTISQFALKRTSEATSK